MNVRLGYPPLGLTLTLTVGTINTSIWITPLIVLVQQGYEAALIPPQDRCPAGMKSKFTHRDPASVVIGKRHRPGGNTGRITL